MTRLYFVTISLLVFCVISVSHAAEGGDGPIHDNPACLLISNHTPRDDVAFRAGVDVYGRTVAPADLAQAGDNVPNPTQQTIIIPITRDLAQKLPKPVQTGMILEGHLGYLEVDPNGQVRWDGQDITADIHALCGKTPPLADGQVGGDVIRLDHQ